MAYVYEYHLFYVSSKQKSVKSILCPALSCLLGHFMFYHFISDYLLECNRMDTFTGI